MYEVTGLTEWPVTYIIEEFHKVRIYTRVFF